MKYLSRVSIIGIMGFCVLVLAASSWAQAPQRAPILDQVAKTYGVDSWDKIDAIRYTWNVDITGLFKASHKWPLKARTKMARRLRLRTTAHSSAASPTK